MDELLGRGIKQIIDEFPQVGVILEEHDIGCVPCALGTCRLADVVEIHGLSPEIEQQMMTSIAKVVWPDRDVVVPLKERKNAAADGALSYSPPMRKLVEEHVLIKRVLALIPALAAALDLEREAGRQRILDVVDFIRNYADKYHHAKEEDVLFGYFDNGLDILQVMHEDHRSGRAHVKAVVEAVEQRDAASVAEQLNGYRVLLTEHIKKEDEILYPWMDRMLSDKQIGQLYARFNEIDAASSKVETLYQRFVEELEQSID